MINNNDDANISALLYPNSAERLNACPRLDKNLPHLAYKRRASRTVVLMYTDWLAY